MPWRRMAWGDQGTLLDVVHGASSMAQTRDPPGAPHPALPLGPLPARKDAQDPDIYPDTPTPALLSNANSSSQQDGLGCSETPGQLLEAMVKSCMPTPCPRRSAPSSTPSDSNTTTTNNHNNNTSNNNTSNNNTSNNNTSNNNNNSNHNNNHHNSNNNSYNPLAGPTSLSAGEVRGGRPSRPCESAPQRQSSGLSLPLAPHSNLSAGAGRRAAPPALSEGSPVGGTGSGRGRASSSSEEEQHQFSMLQQLVRDAGSAQGGQGCTPLLRPARACQPFSGGLAAPSPAAPSRAGPSPAAPSAAAPSPQAEACARLLSALQERTGAQVSGSPRGTPSAASWPSLPYQQTPLPRTQPPESALPAAEGSALARRLANSLGTGSLGATGSFNTGSLGSGSFDTGSLGTKSFGTGSLDTGSHMQLQMELLRQGSGMTEDSVAWECLNGAAGTPQRWASGLQAQQQTSRGAGQLTGPALSQQTLGLQQRLEFSAVAMANFLDRPCPPLGAPGSHRPVSRLSGGGSAASGPSLASAASVSMQEQMLRALLGGAPGASQGLVRKLSPLGSAGLGPTVEDTGGGKRHAVGTASAGSCGYTGDAPTEVTGSTWRRMSLDETRARMSLDDTRARMSLEETRARMASETAAFQARLLGGAPPARSGSGDGQGWASQGTGGEPYGAASGGALTPRGGGSQGPGSECSPRGAAERGAGGDERRTRRLAANREAARRMRKRHSERLLELEAQVSELRRLHQQTTERLNKANEQVVRLETANARLEKGVKGAGSLDNPGTPPNPPLDSSPPQDEAQQPKHTLGDVQTGSAKAEPHEPQDSAGGMQAPPGGDSEDGAAALTTAPPAAHSGAVPSATATAAIDAAGAPKSGAGMLGCKAEPGVWAEEEGREAEPVSAPSVRGRSSGVTPEGETAAPAAASAAGAAPGGLASASGPQLQASGALCHGLGLGGLGDLDTEGLLSTFGGADDCMQDFAHMPMHELTHMRFLDDMH